MVSEAEACEQREWAVWEMLVCVQDRELWHSFFAVNVLQVLTYEGCYGVMMLVKHVTQTHCDPCPTLRIGGERKVRRGPASNRAKQADVALTGPALLNIL